MYKKQEDWYKYLKSKGITQTKWDSFQQYNMRCGYIEPTVIEERSLGSMTAISVYSRLLMDRQIFLGAEINDEVANIIVAQLLWLDQQSDGDVTIILNSGGGSVYDGYAIIDTMGFINADVSTNVVGLAASMGAVIASSGVKGKRFILPHSRFMIHQPLSGMNGFKQASDIEIQSREINKLKQEIYSTLSENSGLSIEQIEKMSDRDLWMTAQEAIDNGFVDKIIDKNLRNK